MGLVVTEPVRIGERVRMPGYELTEEDMVGRNISMMKRQGVVKFMDEPVRRGPGRPRKDETE